MKNNKKISFTLAEVLLVISIIGVIAVLTLPNLGKNVNEEKIIATYRSSLDQVNTAYAKALSEYSSLENLLNLDCTSAGDKGKVPCLGEKIASYLTLQKNCKKANDGSCMSLDVINLDGERKGDDCEYSFVMSNGASVCFISIENQIRMYIDVDGPRNGSNTPAVDIFETIGEDEFIKFYPISDVNANFGDYDHGRWAYEIGNLDYLKCKDQLNWINKKTCD